MLVAAGPVLLKYLLYNPRSVSTRQNAASKGSEWSLSIHCQRYTFAQTHTAVAEVIHRVCKVIKRHAAREPVRDDSCRWHKHYNILFFKKR